MKKVKKQAGFTLAELLIVVAIIAILVAIGIPAFSTAMERSRETVDLSNIRAAYAEFMAASLGGNIKEGYFPITIKQKEANWIIDTSGFTGNISSDGLPNPKTSDGGKYVKFTFEGVTGQKPKCTVETTKDGTETPSGSDVWLVSGS